MKKGTEANTKHKKKLAEQALLLFAKRGRTAFEAAKEAILQEKITYKPVHDALQYFMQEIWFGVQHPALISLTCEAVGGDPKETTSIGAATVLLAGAADIHDDIIDQSKTKGSKLTVFGKFGRDLALLTGDALLFEGLMLLHEACEKFPKRKRQKILTLSKEAFFELGSAEAKEILFKRNFDTTPKECLNIIKVKASIIEAYARIGAIIGDGKPEQIEALGHYGAALGLLTTLRDDFIDVFEPDELKNRADNECLPLPVLYALQNAKIKNEIVPLLKKKKITQKDAYKIVEIIDGLKEIQDLKKEMRLSVKTAMEDCKFIKPNIRSELELVLRASIEDL